MKPTKTFRIMYFLGRIKTTIVPIYMIHTAFGDFCCSGGRRLRLIRKQYTNFIKTNLGPMTSPETLLPAKPYMYDNGPPKVYHFDPCFQRWCFEQTRLLGTDGLKAEVENYNVRVQSHLPGPNLKDMIKDTYKGKCATCGQKIKESPVRKNRMFCSPKCRIRYWRTANSLKRAI